jgi:DNA-binding CsgD family transcriptional regulator
MLSVDSKVNRIEKLLYDTATDSRQWLVFLNELKEYIGASAVLLAKSDYKNYENRIFHAVGIEHEFIRSYEGRFVHSNPWLKQEDRHVRETVFRGENIVTPGSLIKTQFYKEWLLPQGLFYSAFIVVKEKGGKIFYILALRSQLAGAFEDYHLRLLASLLPHLQHATRRGEYLWQLAIMLDVFDCMQFAVMVVDKRRRLLFSNRTTEEYLNSEDGIQIRDGKVWIRGRQNFSSFSNMIVRAATGTEQEEMSTLSKAIMVARHQKKLPLWVIVSPLTRRLRRVVCQEDEVALVYVVIPERVSKMSETRLKTLFDLTNAEQKLAKLILEGYRLDDAAKHLGISINTARTHMKRIYSKTNTERQTDLVRLFLTSPGV